MLHYLINCSAIWLLSLVCFDLFLRRSTFHSYNRFYLLGSLLAGMIIPFVSINADNPATAPAFQSKVLRGTLVAKDNLIDTASVAETHPVNGLEWNNILMLVYLIGVLISATFLLHSIVKIGRLYNKGTKLSVRGLKVIETGQQHGPFSCLGFIFIAQMNHYSAVELSMIITHENRHNMQRHSIDLFITELCKIIFWFNPLPYIYQQRLIMVHEFQADKSVQQPLSEYGTFLAHQAIAQPAPHLSHSFFHSPLKKRIVMLSRTSPKWANCKMLLAIPVVSISLLCFSKTVFSESKRIQKGNKVSFMGREFELKIYPLQKSISTDPVTGKTDTFTYEIVPYPIKMDNETLLNTDSVDKKPTSEKTITEHIKEIFEQNKELFGQLNEGEYDIDIMHFVTGEKGEVLYYKYDGLRNRKNIQVPGSGEWVAQKVLPEDVQNKIDRMIDKMAARIRFTPALKNGKPVACFTEYSVGSPFTFTVKNNKASIKGKEIPAGTYKVVHQSDNDTLEILDVQFVK